MRREPVDDDDVGLCQQRAPTRGDQAGVARPAADQGDVPDAGAAASPERQRADLELRGDRVAQDDSPARVGSGVDGDDDVTDACDGRRPGAACRGIVGTDAPEAPRLGIGGDGVVGAPFTGGGVHQPDAVEVCGGELAEVQRDRAAFGGVPDVFADERRDDVDVGTGVDESPDATSGDRAAPDDQGAPTGKVEQQRIAVHTWIPHSLLSAPAQRPARALSPGRTGRVQGAQPIEAKPSCRRGLTRTPYRRA